MVRISWERLATLAGLAFVVLYVVAFALGIEVGHSDQEIVDHYADGGNRAKEAIAFFLIATAGLSFALVATALKSLVARAEQGTTILAALAWAGGIVAVRSSWPAMPYRGQPHSPRCRMSSSSTRIRADSSKTSGFSSSRAER